ncbi:hypothetical protein DMENIID0001_163110 [Sergentomyia squamirostris]
MSYCGVCKSTVQRGTSKISCSRCGGLFHTGCLKLSQSDFAKTTTPNPTWCCVQCSVKDRRNSIGGASGGLPTQSDQASRRVVPSQSVAASLDAFRQAFEKGMKDLNGFREDFSGGMADLNEALSIIKDLKMEIVKLKTENESLQTHVCALEARLEDCNRVRELNAIEVSGVPDSEESADPYTNAAAILSSALDLDVSVDSIADCQIIKPMRRTSGPQEGQSGNLWIIRLGTKRLRDGILKAVRSKGKRVGWQFPCKLSDGRDCSVRVRERVTSQARRLYNAAKERARANNWKFVWIVNGGVLVKVGEGARVHVIKSISDIDKIANE